MLQNVLFSLWFLLPAAIANATPIFVAAIPGLKRFNTRLDGGRTFRGKPIFGEHKTWRGLLSGMLTATLVFMLQKYAVAHAGWAAQLAQDVDYAALSLLLGPLFGFGALGGDAVESFFKRQRGIGAGEQWVPFDQLDYIVGAIVVSLLFVQLPYALYLYMIMLWFLAHVGASYIGYLLRLKEKPI